MSLFQRLFNRPRDAVPKTETPHGSLASATSAPVAAPVQASPLGPTIDARTLADIVRVEETSEAAFYAGDLFRRRFGGEPPDYPKHYVAFYRQASGAFLSIGYIHYTAFEDTYLCGGMVIDDRMYRKIPGQHRKLIRDAGGIAEIMLRETFARLAEAPAIWGYVGDKQAEEVDARVGFVHTGHPRIMVVWNRPLPDDEKAARLARVAALGPF